MDFGRRMVSAWLAAAACVSLFSPIASGPAHGASPEAIATLIGSYGGSGRISYTDGSSETLNCTAYYTAAGSELRMNIQCRSDKNPIHIRSHLRFDGRRLSGEWEERTFNAAGTATGSSDTGKITLSLSGGGFTGTMSVTYTKAAHSVAITTQGVPMSRATIQLSRR